jgi:hypothetical protein
VGIQTTQDRQPEKISQFTVFMENKAGRLLELVRLLESHEIHIIGFTILDTSEASTIRLVVDDPQNARKILAENGISYTECSLIALELPQSAEDLRKVLTVLLQAEINIYFSYPFLTRPYGKAVLALRVEDEELAISVLLRNNYRVLFQKDISR